MRPTFVFGFVMVFGPGVKILHQLNKYLVIFVLPFLNGFSGVVCIFFHLWFVPLLILVPYYVLSIIISWSMQCVLSIQYFYVYENMCSPWKYYSVYVNMFLCGNTLCLCKCIFSVEIFPFLCKYVSLWKYFSVYENTCSLWKYLSVYANAFLCGNNYLSMQTHVLCGNISLSM